MDGFSTGIKEKQSMNFLINIVRVTIIASPSSWPDPCLD
jgi:hypothetical protein